MSTDPPAAPATTETNGNVSTISTLSPTQNKEHEPEPDPQDQGGSPKSASQDVQPDARHTASREESTVENSVATETSSDRPGSKSPGGTKKGEGPADIPSQKLAFGEDKRALKALDKVFI